MLTKTHANQYNSKILPFNDGFCQIYTIEKRTAKDYLGTFDFRDETVGVQAYTGFQTLGIQVDRVISIPYNTKADVGRILKINQDTNFYQIVMMQVKENIPKSLRLTLTKTNLKWNEGENDD